MTDQNIILRWNGLNPSADSKESWYVRGIRPDGSFYGEIKIGNEESYNLVNLERTLRNQENKEIQALVAELVEFDSQSRLDNDDYTGIVALGQISDPYVILKYSRARHGGSEIALKFERILELIRPYMQGT